MKHPCAWCGQHPVVYRGTEYCSYKCWADSLRAVQGEPVQEIVLAPEPLGTLQLDLFEKVQHTR